MEGQNLPTNNPANISNLNLTESQDLTVKLQEIQRTDEWYRGGEHLSLKCVMQST